MEALFFSLFRGLRPLWCLPCFPDLWCIPYASWGPRFLGTPRNPDKKGPKPSTDNYWEVLNGVGVDGVGGIFPFFSFFFVFLRFSSFFFVFLRFSSLFFVFLRFSSFFFVFCLFSWNKGKRLQFTGKMGNFTPTPSAPTPFGTSRN